MANSSLACLLIAAPPIMGSFIVLAIAAVGRSVWITHLLAIFLSCGLALALSLMAKPGHRHAAAQAVITLTLIGLAIPLFGDSSEPERWISLGPLMLYVAPLLLPSFIAACSILVGKDARRQWISLAAVLSAVALLTLQPDASQVLGLLVASAVVAAQCRLGVFRSGIVVLPLAALTLWAFSVPDPLAPVPYVEGVFALGLSHSLLAGMAVITSALALIVGLSLLSLRGPAWLCAVAAYYTVVFVCSAAGITPAPLVGYGAGPILGFGLMAGLLGWFEQPDQPSKSMQPLITSRPTKR